MKRNVSTGFAVIVVVLFILALSGIYWFMGKQNVVDAPVMQLTQQTSNATQQQTPQTTSQSDKIVYENKEAGFSLELPENWKEYTVENISQKNDSNSPGHLFFKLPSREWNQSAPVFSILIETMEQHARIEDLCQSGRMKELQQWYNKDHFQVVIAEKGSRPDKQEQSLIDSGKAMLVTPQEEDDVFTCGHLPMVIARGQGLVFSYDRVDKITDYPKEFTKLGYFDQADQIIKSFKLINQTSIDTSDWQTYRNEQYGFEVKAPKEWKEKTLVQYDENHPNIKYNAFYSGLTFNENKDDPANSYAQLAFIYYDDISAVSYTKTQPKTFDEYKKDVSFSNVKEMTFNGEKAFSAEKTMNDNLKKVALFIEHKGHIYEIFYDAKDKDIVTIEAVIDTLRFL